jgi:hypothetical protein
MDNERNYYEQKIYEIKDSLISTNSIKLCINASKDKYGFSCLFLGVNIINFKSRVFMNYNMDSSKSNLYIDKLTKLVSNYDSLISELQNTNKSKSFEIHDFRKLVTTFLFRTEYNNVCVRISIGETNREVIDSSSIYLLLEDYISFSKVIEQFNNNYLQTSILFNNNILLNEKINNISEPKYKEVINDFIPENFNIIPSVQTTIAEVDVSSSTASKIEDMVLNSEMVDFLDKNVDKMDIGLNQFEKFDNRQPAIFTISDNFFTDKIISNDVLKLEDLLINCLNSPLPLEKFIESIEKETNKSLNLNGEMSHIHFLVTNFLKFYINKHLQERQQLPSKTIPIFFKATKKDAINISLMYDLFVYFCYYSILSSSLSIKDHNTTNNRMLHCFIIKSIFSPLIFSFFYGIERDVLLDSTLKRFNDYKNKGVFNELELKIKSIYNYFPEIDHSTMKLEISKTIDSIFKLQDKYTLQIAYNNFNSKEIISVPYDLFNQGSFSNEQILKLVVLNLYFIKKKKIDLVEIEKITKIKDFTDLPVGILNYFKMNSNKIDNSNLIRYVTQTFKDDKNLQKFLELCKFVNKSYRDLKNKNIDFINLPEQLLKAIYLWDTELDGKIKNNYLYYSSLINNSNLNHSMLVSILNKIEDRLTSNFVETLNSLNEIGA